MTNVLVNGVISKAYSYPPIIFIGVSWVYSPIAIVVIDVPSLTFLFLFDPFFIFLWLFKVEINLAMKIFLCLAVLLGLYHASLANITRNCNLYNTASQPATCPPGSYLHGSLCTEPCPANYTMISACLCGGARPHTSCDTDASTVVLPVDGACQYPNTELIGGLCYEPCKVGKRLLACTCEVPVLQKVCTPTIPTCPQDYDLYAGTCHQGKCPLGSARNDECSCKAL